jgi:PPM family protein phosphatase
VDEVESMTEWQDFIKRFKMKEPRKDTISNTNDIDTNNKKNNNRTAPDGNELLSSTTTTTAAVTKYDNHHEKQQPPLRKSIGFASDIGLTRSTDEDSIVIMDLMTCFEGKKRRKVILILADGMGGHYKGEVASKIGVRTLATELHRFLSDADMNEEKYYDLFTKAFSVANWHILRYSDTHPEAEGMGTTTSLAIIDENQQLYIGNVGDSRVYIINREEGAIQLTKDHTFVQELVDKGKITKEEARRHPKKNVLNQAVGSFADVKVDTCSLRLDDNDYVLLCCDGLINHVSDGEMAQIVLNNSANPQEACDRLVALANKRGGKDNISVIIAPANMMKT